MSEGQPPLLPEAGSEGTPDGAPESAQDIPPPEPPPGREPFWGYSDLVLFVGLAIPSMLLGSLLVKGILAALRFHSAIKVIELLSAQFLGYAFLFGALSLVFHAKYGRPLWRSLGWNPIRVPVALLLSSGLVTAFLVAFASSLIHTPETSNPLTELMQGRAAVILLAVFGVTLGPVFEELAFRGFLQPLLVRSLGAAPGIAMAAIPFGLLHYQEYGNSWRHALVISLAGASFGVMRHVTGSTKAAAIMHAAYNSLFFLVLFAQKKDLAHGW
jgi:membrane protease YdiL (CAAX protease family)